MKKLIYILAIAIASFSCSKDDSPSTSNDVNIDNIFVKKITETDDLGNTSIYNCNYDGKKLTSIVNKDDSGEKTVYTYDGNKIVKIEEYEGGEIIEEIIIGYSGDNVDFIETTTTDDDEYEFKKKSNILLKPVLSSKSAIYGNRLRKEFKYNSNGTVSTTDYVWDESLNSFYQLNEDTETIIKLNSSKQQAEITTKTKIDETKEFIGTVSFTYDSSNNPFRNVVGFNSWLGFEYGRNNIKLIKITSNAQEIIDATEDEDEKALIQFLTSFLGIEVEATYTYNSNNFPEKANLKIKMGSMLNTGTAKFEY